MSMAHGLPNVSTLAADPHSLDSESLKQQSDNLDVDMGSNPGDLGGYNDTGPCLFQYEHFF
jgi:hypothetical protein